MNPFVARAPAVLGAILGLVAIWVDVTSTGGKYWDGASHALGISMLVLLILVGLGLVLATWLQNRALDQAWLLPALVLGGLYLFFPIGAWGEGATGAAGRRRLAGRGRVRPIRAGRDPERDPGGRPDAPRGGRGHRGRGSGGRPRADLAHCNGIAARRLIPRSQGRGAPALLGRQRLG